MTRTQTLSLVRVRVRVRFGFGFGLGLGLGFGFGLGCALTLPEPLPGAHGAGPSTQPLMGLDEHGKAKLVEAAIAVAEGRRLTRTLSLTLTLS